MIRPKTAVMTKTKAPAEINILTCNRAISSLIELAFEAVLRYLKEHSLSTSLRRLNIHVTGMSVSTKYRAKVRRLLHLNVETGCTKMGVSESKKNFGGVLLTHEKTKLI